MALEIAIWAHEPRALAQQQPLCEALIPLASAKLKGSDYWPLRRPLGSPHLRRKSLNDLLGKFRFKRLLPAAVPATRCIATDLVPRAANRSSELLYASAAAAVGFPKPAANDGGGGQGLFGRQRSSSNRNLPERPLALHQLNQQPRRASDELFRGRAQKLLSLSPGQSRRAISALNVGAGGSSGTLSPATQARIQVARRNSRHSELLAAKPASPRRASVTTAVPVAGVGAAVSAAAGGKQQPEVSKPRAAPLAPTSSLQGSLQEPRGECARRLSAVEATIGGAGLQRKGSLAAQTLRKLKRTMSLTKASVGASSPAGNATGPESQSSFESAEADGAGDSEGASVASDVGVPPRLMARRGKWRAGAQTNAQAKPNSSGQR